MSAEMLGAKRGEPHMSIAWDMSAQARKVGRRDVKLFTLILQ